jgi:hypothetical protein
VTRPLYVHLGCSKTGTSSLQAGMWRSVEAMASAGVGLPFKDREAHLTHLLRPLGWRPVDAFAQPANEARLAQVPEILRSTPGERLLVSNEDLAELTHVQAKRIAGFATEADLDLHLVLTVRGWADQVPSEYQQFLKHRMTLTYPEFVDAVRDREGEWAERFWRRQDPVRVLDEWAGLVEPAKVHVIAVPSYSKDPDGVFRMMGEAVGFDASVIQRPTGALNSSFGVVEAELWRRVNVALGDRLPEFTRGYGSSLRFPFERGVIPKLASPRVGLPDEVVPWLQEHARETVATLEERGYVLAGDFARLVPRDDAGRPVVVPSEKEIADAAVLAIANLAVRHDERVKGIRATLKADATPRPESSPRPRWLRWGR